jgi:hypothetical protein
VAKEDSDICATAMLVCMIGPLKKIILVYGHNCSDGAVLMSGFTSIDKSDDDEHATH